MTVRPCRYVTDAPKCVPLCGVTKAYGRFAHGWQHEPLCPVRIAYEAAKDAAKEAQK